MLSNRPTCLQMTTHNAYTVLPTAPAVSDWEQYVRMMINLWLSEVQSLKRPFNDCLHKWDFMAYFDMFPGMKLRYVYYLKVRWIVDLIASSEPLDRWRWLSNDATFKAYQFTLGSLDIFEQLSELGRYVTSSWDGRVTKITQSCRITSPTTNNLLTGSISQLSSSDSNWLMQLSWDKREALRWIIQVSWGMTLAFCVY